MLLFYVGLQEARILLTEGKDRQASIVLTELLEKTKYYLPYYRLMCLSNLVEIFRKLSLNVSPVERMVARFDDEITFRVSSVIAVNSAYS